MPTWAVTTSARGIGAPGEGLGSALTRAGGRGQSCPVTGFPIREVLVLTGYHRRFTHSLISRVVCCVCCNLWIPDVRNPFLYQSNVLALFIKPLHGKVLLRHVSCGRHALKDHNSSGFRPRGRRGKPKRDQSKLLAFQEALPRFES